jgi:hypothetical protein
MFETIESPRKSSAELRVERLDPDRLRPRTRACRAACRPAGRRRVADRFGDRDLVQVREHLRAAVANGRERLRRRRDDDVAGQHRVGLLRVDAHLVQRRRVLGESHERQHRAALLREAHEVEHAGRLAFEVRGHRDQRADRDHAGAADAGDEQVVRAGPGVPAGSATCAGRSSSRAAPAPLSAPMRFFRLAPLTPTKLGQKPFAHE